MQDANKTKAQLIEELATLRSRVVELERINADRNQAVESLQASEARYRSFFATNLAGMWCFELRDPMPVDLPVDDQINWILKKAIMAECNDVYAQMYGFDRGQHMIGLKLRDLWGEDEEAAFNVVHEFVTSGYKFDQIETYEQMRSGEYRYFFNLRHSVVENDHLIRFWGNQIDITERKRAEVELAKERDFSRTLVQASPTFFVAIDSEGKTMMMNELMLEALGYKHEEVLGKDYLSTFVPEADREGLAAVFQKLLHTREPTVNENRVLTREGSELLVEWHGQQIFSPDGKLEYFFGVGIDITERKRAEEALRESEEKYRSIFNNAQVGIYRTRISDGKMLECNDRLAAMFAYQDREECLAEFVASEHYIDPGTREMMLGEIKDKGEISNLEARLLCKDGSVKWIQYSAKIFPEKGYLEGVATDITEQRKTEQALRQSEERFRSTFEHAQVGIIEGTTNEFIEVNPRACQFFGYSREELLTKSFYELTHPDDVEASLRFIREIRENPNQFRSLEKRYIRQDGTVVWGEATLSILFDAEGNIRHHVVCIVDITKRKQAEEERKRLRSFLKNIIDSMPSVLIGIDSDGRVTHWNREAQAATGLTSRKAIGMLLEDGYPALQGQMEKVRKAVKERNIQKSEKLIRYIDGEKHFMDVVVYPLKSDSVEGAVIRVDDITARVRMEEMIIQSEKMLSVGGLAAGMAHEINNPLAGILQSVQVALDRISFEITANEETARKCGTTLESIRNYMEQRKITEMLASIKEAGLRASKIVDNMLSFSRTGGAHFVSHNVCELLDQTINLAASDYDLKKKYDFRQIKIVREYQTNLPNIACEGTKIQQVILNLLKNGAQAMAERKNRNEPSKFILRAMREGDMMRIEVQDNGPGMSEEVRRRVFEPFFTTKEVGEGTGLGLSVSYFIVTENHGGTMTVESSPGKGAKFIIHLPLQRNGS